MDVFIVTVDEHYETRVLEVFSTWELAEQYVVRECAKLENKDNYYEILVCVVMDEMPMD